MLRADEAYRLGEFQLALTGYTKAADAYANLRQQASQDLDGADSENDIKGLQEDIYATKCALALMQKARCHRELGDPDRASESEELARTLMLSVGKGHTLEAITRPWELANDWERMAGEERYAADHAYAHGHLDDAVRLYDAALAILGEIQAFLENVSHSAALTGRESLVAGLAASFQAVNRAYALTSLSDCYRELGDHEQARAYEEESERVMSSVTRLTLADIKAPWILLREANRQLLRGDYEQTIALASRAYQTATAEDEELLSNDKYSLQSLVIMGKAYDMLGLTEFAKECYEEGLSIAYDMDDTSYQAEVLTLLGICDLESEDRWNAEIAFTRALQTYNAQQDDAGLATCYLFLGLARPPGDEEAIRLIEKSLRAAEHAQLEGLEVDALVALAGLCWLQGDLDTAYVYLNRCLSITETADLVLPPSVASIHHLVASYFAEKGDSANAVEHYEQAIHLVEASRCHLEAAAMKTLHMSKHLTSYHGLVATLLDLGDNSSALQYAERIKARTLSDMIETAMIVRNDILPKSVQTAAQSYQALAAVQATASNPLLKTFSSTLRAALSYSNQQHVEEYGALLADLEKEHPQLGRTISLTAGELTQQLEYAQRQLGARCVVLEYLVLREETIIWAITGAGIQVVERVAISSTDLTAEVRSFHNEIRIPPPHSEAAVSLRSVMEKGRDLYNLLIAPVAPYLEQAENLVIIPSDVLFYLPFAALFNCPNCTGPSLMGGKYLAEEFSISYAPSLSSLYWPMANRHQGAYDSILAIGADPDPGRPLQYSEDEALATASLFPTARVLTKNECTESKVKLLLGQRAYDVIHLSTHGSFDPVVPMLSRVRLLAERGEDGDLHAGEIMAFNLRGSLVVLSACQTALPAKLTLKTAGLMVGDEIHGMGQALFAAGASSAMLTLWNVNDRSTRYLMEWMYEALTSESGEKGEALRHAQCLLIDDPTYHHPCYWAPFVLYGDWR